ncbi:hypothetical protein BDV93DRAFT_365051 [Ceratobasidium sp. AG-I]|nr:hypothetical protein BDV93DRAFT_365051 [Ceratobasidium sp. AG-I]
MPPLISIPVASPPSSKQRSSVSKADSVDSHVSSPRAQSPAPALVVEETTKTSEPPALVSPKAQEGFSPFRWFGFGRSPSGQTAEKAPEPTPALTPAPVPAPVPAPMPVAKAESVSTIEPTPETESAPEPVLATPSKEEAPAKSVLTSPAGGTTSPSAPQTEKIQWSRWPYRPATGLATPTVAPGFGRTPVVANAQVLPVRPEPRAVMNAPSVSTSKSPTVASAMPIVPVIPAASVQSVTPVVAVPARTASTASPPPRPTMASPPSSVVSSPPRSTTATPSRSATATPLRVSTNIPPVTFVASTPKASASSPITTTTPSAPIPPLPLPKAVAPSPIPSRIEPPRAVLRQTWLADAASPSTPERAHSMDTQERAQRKVTPPASDRTEKRAATLRAVSPSVNASTVTFRSPQTPSQPLPMRMPQSTTTNGSIAESGSRPMPRSILKQRTVDAVPVVAVPQPRAPQFEFTRLRDVPIYDDWQHAPAVRRDILASTTTARSPREETQTSPTSRNRVPGDMYRQRSTGVPTPTRERERGPSPSRQARTPVKSARDPVSVSNDRVTRSKVTKPNRISTTLVHSPNGTYIEPLTSPILLTSDNYGMRLPENTIYQYDVQISPAESLVPATRKKIFDTLQKTVAPELFSPLARTEYDGGKMMYAHRKLKVSGGQEFEVQISEPSQDPQMYKVILKRTAAITPNIVPAFR